MVGSGRWRIVAAAATAAFAITSCSRTHLTPGQRSAERRYVDGVHISATDIGQFRTDSQLVKLGHVVCDGYRANANTQQVADLLERTGAKNLPPQDLGAVISTAVKELCPGYSGLLNPVSQ